MLVALNGYVVAVYFMVWCMIIITWVCDGSIFDVVVYDNIIK